MSGLTLVLGGVRSGKSGFAKGLCEGAEGADMGGESALLYIATAEGLDDEMRGRIRRHQSERGGAWVTLEEPVEVAARLSKAPRGSVILLDCLTLWLSNLMGLGLEDEEILVRVDELAGIMSRSSSAVVAVSNDVGGGVMPANALARRFGDLSGFMNQRMAGAADEVYFLTAGIPRRLK